MANYVLFWVNIQMFNIDFKPLLFLKTKKLEALKSQNAENFIIGGVFVLFLAIGAINVFDYGISCDEQQQRSIGKINWNYIFQGDKRLFQFGDRYYGPFWELCLIGLEKMFSLLFDFDIFDFRHLAGHIFFLVSGVYLFKSFRILGIADITAGLISLLYITQPELYTHSFFNSKDIPFMSFMVLTFYCWIKYVLDSLNNKQGSKCAYLFLIIAGLTTSLRLIGGVWFLLYLSQIIIKKESVKGKLYCLLGSMFVFVLALFISWPILWHSPVKELYWGVFTMLHFGFGDLQLFEGVFLQANNLPWYYLLKYIFIKNSEILWILLAFVIFYGVLATRCCSKIKYTLMAFSFNFILPILIVVIFGSTIYNGWRHFYFVFPFVLFLIGTLTCNLDSVKKRIFMLIAAFTIMHQGFILCSFHPFGHLYFNKFVSNVERNYEVDYWGVAHYNALKYISKYDRKSSVSIFNNSVCGAGNLLKMTKEEVGRIKFVNIMEEANYVISNVVLGGNNTKFSLYYSISLHDTPFLFVYKQTTR